MALGIGSYFSLHSEPVWYLGPVFLGIISALGLGFGGFFSKHQNFLFFMIAIGTVALGFSAAQIRTLNKATTSLQRDIGPLGISGRVTDMETMPKGSRVILENLHIDGAIEAYEIPDRVRIRINTTKGDRFRPGDWIRIYAVLRPPSPPASPHSFDFQRYAWFKGIGAVGYSMGIPEVIKYAGEDLANTAFSFNLLQSQLRQSVGERIRKALPGEIGMLAMALITGEKKAIPEATVNAMRNAGLAHLLAISGLHIGLVAGLVFFIVRAGLAMTTSLAVQYPIKTWAALSALLAALGYTVLAGSTIPTLRAFTMMALVLGAITIGRRGITLRLVGVAAMVILLFQPESLLGASFQLSFAAVTGLVACYEVITLRFRNFWHRQGLISRVVLYVAGVGLSTLIAGLSTAPFAAYHFHQLASYGLIANLVAVPITALWIMPSALIAMLAMPFGLEVIGLVPMGWGIDILITVAKTVAVLPGNVQAIPAFPVAALVMMAIGGLWLGIWQHTVRLLGLGGVAAGLFLAMNTTQPALLAHTSGEIIAIRDDTTITVLGPGARANRFTRKVWTKRAGFMSHESFKQNEKDIKCDYTGCLFRKNGLTIALVWEEAALMEDCWVADIIVSRVPVRRSCPKPQHIIDRFDLWQNGAYAIYLDENNVRIESTADVRGSRPWTITPKSRTKNKSKALPSTDLES